MQRLPSNPFVPIELEFDNNQTPKINKVRYLVEDDIVEILKNESDSKPFGTRREATETQEFEESESSDISNEERSPQTEQRVYNIIYGRHKPGKKKKEFQFDGTLVVCGQTAIIKDENGREISRCSEFLHNDLSNLTDGCQLVIGAYECEINE